jgi:hypothetical protein
MALDHPYGEQWLAHLAATQQSYAERRLADYLDGFNDSYFSVQLHTQWAEDKAALEKKILRDFDRFDLLEMDFTVLRAWYAGEQGYAHLGYVTKLRVRETGRTLVDRRENLLVGHHRGAGRWGIDCKVVLKAENLYEDGAPEV